ncbi:hypothetical protein D3C73_680290 [compost metagenome]
MVPSNKHARSGGYDPAAAVSGIFNALHNGGQQQPLDGVHHFRFFVGNFEVFGIELVNLLQISPFFIRYLLERAQCTLLDETFDTLLPALRKIADAINLMEQIIPVFIQIRSARKAPGHPDDRDVLMLFHASLFDFFKNNLGLFDG